MIFDGLSNNNKITWNLNHYQSISIKHTHTYIYILIFFCYLFENRCQDDQDNTLSRDPFPLCFVLNKNLIYKK
jgi:hypothetical protein